MANGNKITPTINSTGLFKVEKPFVVDMKRIYEVTAIREFDDFWVNGVDIYTEYYKPVGLSEDIYKRDVAAGAAIITLKSELGSVYVPDTFIISYPEMGYQNYKHVVLSVSLGALSDDQNIEALLKDIRELCAKHIGVEGTVQKHSAPLQSALTRSEVDSMEKVRDGLKSVPQSNALKLKQAQERLAAMTAINNNRLVKIKVPKFNSVTNEVKPEDNYVVTYESKLPSYRSPMLDSYMTAGSWGNMKTNSLQNVVNSASAFYDWFTDGKQQLKDNPVVNTSRSSKQSTKEKHLNSFAYSITKKYKNI